MKEYIDKLYNLLLQKQKLTIMPIYMPKKKEDLFKEFQEYHKKHPNERFWQALKNWCKVNKIYIEKYDKKVDDFIAEDTFYFESKLK